MTNISIRRRGTSRIARTIADTSMSMKTNALARHCRAKFLTVSYDQREFKWRLLLSSCHLISPIFQDFVSCEVRVANFNNHRRSGGTFHIPYYVFSNFLLKFVWFYQNVVQKYWEFSFRNRNREYHCNTAVKKTTTCVWGTLHVLRLHVMKHESIGGLGRLLTQAPPETYLILRLATSADHLSTPQNATIKFLPACNFHNPARFRHFASRLQGCKFYSPTKFKAPVTTEYSTRENVRFFDASAYCV